jgi:hypothetical protein
MYGYFNKRLYWYVILVVWIWTLNLSLKLAGASQLNHLSYTLRIFQRVCTVKEWNFDDLLGNLGRVWINSLIKCFNEFLSYKSLCISCIYNQGGNVVKLFLSTCVDLFLSISCSYKNKLNTIYLHIISSFPYSSKHKCLCNWISPN